MSNTHTDVLLVGPVLFCLVMKAIVFGTYLNSASAKEVYPSTYTSISDLEALASAPVNIKPTLTNLIQAGAFAAFSIDLLVYPLDTLKTRVQSPNYKKI